MANINIGHHAPLLGRRRPAVGLDGTVHFITEPRLERSLADKVQEHDRAPGVSQHMALSRRKFPMGGSVMNMSALAPAQSSSSMFGGVSTAQTAVLGDSNGSVLPADTGNVPGSRSETSSEEAEQEHGVASGLGGSYVDGTRRTKPYGDGDEDDEDGLRDGGVLSLLAQIYGRREGTAGVL